MDRGKRYKQRGMRFTSAEDSRALRAIDSKVARHAKRDALLSCKRMDGLGASTITPSQGETKLRSKPILAEVSRALPKKSDRELGLQRYQELLKWKADRRKKLNVEKRHRKPSFDTSIYQPDQPKFLLSDDVKIKTVPDVNTPAKETPFKYLQRSSSKYGYTPGGSTKKIPRFCSGVTPGTSVPKVSKFSLRTTPNQSLGRAAILQKRTSSQKENLSSNLIVLQERNEDRGRTSRKGKSVQAKDMKRILRGRITRRHEPSLNVDDDLGVQAIPITPISVRLRKSLRSSGVGSDLSSTESLRGSAVGSDLLSSGEVVESLEVPSFAPQDFAFNFTKDSGDAQLQVEKEDEPEVTSEANEKEDEEDEEIVKDADTTFDKDEKNNTAFDKDEKNDTTFDKDKIVSDESGNEEDHSAMSDAIAVALPNETEEETVTLSNREDEDETVDDDSIPENEIEEKMECEEVENIVVVSNAEVERGEENETADNGTSLSNSATLPKEHSDKSLGSDRNDAKVLDSNVNSPCVLPEIYGSHASAVNETPMSVRRRRSRRSSRLGGCLDTTLTPLMSKLRPRTPCSRSTRRSLKAHTDDPLDKVFTPKIQKSARRSMRRSANRGRKTSEIKELKVPLNFYEDESDLADTHSEEPMTDEPVSMGRDDHIIVEEMEEETAVASSVEEDDKSASAAEDKEIQHTPKQSTSNMKTPSTSRHKGRVSWLVRESPFINTEKRSGNNKKRRSGVPSDIISLFDDVPMDGSPLPEHLTPLLNKHRQDLGQSPVLASDEGANTSCMQDASSPPAEDQTCSNLLALLQPTVLSDRTETPDIDVWGEQSPEKTNGDESEVAAADSSKIDVDLSTSMAAPRRTRRSCRISLLPGLSDTPMSAGLSVVSEDLISWETPMLPSKKTTKIEKLKPTPVRYSRRLSKACLE